MKVEPLKIEGSFWIDPDRHEDERGWFSEWYRRDFFWALGHPLPIDQVSMSTSRRGTVRGVHFVDTPPGQAKYVTCIRGAIVDFIVDIRVGSPTFGQHQDVHLNEIEGSGVYLTKGLGHAICALTQEATLLYACSSTYDPGIERRISPLDPNLELEFPMSRTELILSDLDLHAPTLAEAMKLGILPEYGNL